MLVKVLMTVFKIVSAINDYQKANEIDPDSRKIKEGLNKAQKLQKQANKKDYYKILGVKRYVFNWLVLFNSLFPSFLFLWVVLCVCVCVSWLQAWSWRAFVQCLNARRSTSFKAVIRLSRIVI